MSLRDQAFLAYAATQPMRVPRIHIAPLGGWLEDAVLSSVRHAIVQERLFRWRYHSIAMLERDHYTPYDDTLTDRRFYRIGAMTNYVDALDSSRYPRVLGHHIQRVHIGGYIIGYLLPGAVVDLIFTEFEK